MIFSDLELEGGQSYNPTRFFGLNPILDSKFGLSQVGLDLRVEKQVQLGRVGLK